MEQKEVPRKHQSYQRRNLQFLYLQVLGVIQLIAFWSYYVQYPGLLSSSGIEPVQRIFARVAPFVYHRFIRTGFIDEDSLCELLALTGMLVSTVIASGYCQHALLFATNIITYNLLARTGGTFFSFQWDTLLLETMFVTCLTYAPWLHLTVPTTALSQSSAPPSGTGPVPLRFLLFKLMLMAGVVKLQARCPTWEQLTALEYHFATQCLPGPLAWYAHQLPPFLLRLGVAATLWIEIPVAVLLVVPFTYARRVGVVLQILLQVLILLTGNYNFFNLLTIALCIPVWDETTVSGNNSDDNNSSTGNGSSRSARLTRSYRIGQGLTMAFLVRSVCSMFQIERSRKDHNLNILLMQDSMWIQPGLFLPVVPYAILVLVIVTAVRSKSITKIVHGMVCVSVIAVVALPLSQVYTDEQFLYPLLGRFHQTYLQPYWLVNGYGLFRKMTGVGIAPPEAKGWAGLPPSVVARPEIILEGLYDKDNDVPAAEKETNPSKDVEEWEELKLFRWKPSALDVWPRQVAPHQPRLDWQMWFAALGSINYNPWLVHLIQKLFDGCEPVLDLVGNSTITAQTKKLRKIRAILYHYDFTRVDTTWSQTIPGVQMLSDKSSVFTSKPSQVWTRTFVRQYLPPVEPHDLKDFLQSQGYKIFCTDPSRPCAHLRNRWCLLAATIRRFRMYLLLPFGLVTLLLKRMLLRRQVGDSERAERLLQKRRKERNLEEKKCQ